MLHGHTTVLLAEEHRARLIEEARRSRLARADRVTRLAAGADHLRHRFATLWTTPTVLAGRPAPCPC